MRRWERRYLLVPFASLHIFMRSSCSRFEFCFLLCIHTRRFEVMWPCLFGAIVLLLLCVMGKKKEMRDMQYDNEMDALAFCI